MANKLPKGGCFAPARTTEVFTCYGVEGADFAKALRPGDTVLEAATRDRGVKVSREVEQKCVRHTCRADEVLHGDKIQAAGRAYEVESSLVSFGSKYRIRTKSVKGFKMVLYLYLPEPCAEVVVWRKGEPTPAPYKPAPIPDDMRPVSVSHASEFRDGDVVTQTLHGRVTVARKVEGERVSPLDFKVGDLVSTMRGWCKVAEITTVRRRGLHYTEVRVAFESGCSDTFLVADNSYEPRRKVCRA